MIKEKGQVIPFAQSAQRLRQGAARRRREGRGVEAVELLRGAYRSSGEDSDLLELAKQLRVLGCEEAAEPLLLRLVSREEPMAESYLTFGWNQWALGRRPLAVDCLNHYLQEDPFSVDADAARSAVCAVSDEVDGEPGRLGALVRRALAAQQSGQDVLALRRMYRAIRLKNEKSTLYAMLALMLLAQRDMNGALRCQARAIRLAPGNMRPRAELCLTLCAMGKRRAARAMLAYCGQFCGSPEAERQFLSVAAVVGTDDLLRRFLTRRLIAQPWRIPLMHQLAALELRQGRAEAAARLYERALRLDASDLEARVMLAQARKTPEKRQGDIHALLTEEVQRRLFRMMDVNREMLLPGSDERETLAWSFRHGGETLQETLLTLVLARPGAETDGFLRELICSPSTAEAVRHKAMTYLIEQEDRAVVTLCDGAQLQKANLERVEPKSGRLGRRFLAQLLRDGQTLQEPEALLRFAAGLWRRMTRQQRLQAAVLDRYSWIKAMEVASLMAARQEASAWKTLSDAMVSPRRIGRIVRALDRLTQQEGSDAIHEVH